MKNKIVIVLLSVVLCLSVFAGCKTEQGNEIKTNTYDVTWQDAKCGKIDKFDYTFVGGPSAEQFVENLDTHLAAVDYTGFTMLQLKCSDGKYFAQKVEPILKEHGYTASVVDSRITDIIKKRPETDEIYKTVERIVKEYEGCSTLTTWDIADGAFESEFDVLGVIVDAFRRYDPSRKTNINILPNYMFSASYGGNGGNEAYEAYVKKFMEVVRPSYLSVFHYDVTFSWERDGINNVHHMIDRDSPELTRINNYEIIRKYAKEYDTDIRFVVQFSLLQGNARLDSRRMRYIYNLAAAYGAKQICVFAYYDGGAAADTSVVGTDWNIQSKTEILSEANPDMLSLMSAVSGKTVSEIFHFNPDASNCFAVKYTGYGDLGNNVTVDTENDSNRSMITFYTDGSFLITDTRMWYNPQKTSQRYSQLKFSNLTLEWFDTETGEWLPAEKCKRMKLSKEGEYTLKIETAESFIFRVAK